jgi:hypothetical protein
MREKTTDRHRQQQQTNKNQEAIHCSSKSHVQNPIESSPVTCTKGHDMLTRRRDDEPLSTQSISERTDERTQFSREEEI